MARSGSAPITKQPNHDEVYNTFGMMGNEKCIYEWTFERGTCGCMTTSYNTLTDTRLLIRRETTNWCNCCSELNRTDSSIFLRDIAELRRSTEVRDNCSCCSRTAKMIELRGTFGSTMVHIPEENMENFQIEICATIGNHKLISHH